VQRSFFRIDQFGEPLNTAFVEPIRLRVYPVQTSQSQGDTDGNNNHGTISVPPYVDIPARPYNGKMTASIPEVHAGDNWVIVAGWTSIATGAEYEKLSEPLER